ncbi:MAG: O-antigen ligase family protein, partial [bacterium]
MKKKRQNNIPKIIVVFFLIILFLVPLIFLVPVSSVDLTKIGVLYGGLSLILCLFVYKFSKDKEFPRIISPILVPIVLFFWAAIFSTIFSQYPYLSFIGDYNRLQGLLTITAYILLFYISFLLSRNKKVLSLMLNTILLSNFFAGIYGIIQRLGLDPYQWSGGVWTRIHSTFGNPVFYAAWLSMVLPLNLVLYLKEDNKKERLIYAISFIYTYILLLFANTRATFVGYFGASILFFLFLLRKRLVFIFYGILIFIFGVISTIIILFLNPIGIPSLAIGGLFIGIFFFGLFFFLSKKPEFLKIKNEILGIGIICIILTIIFNLEPSSIAGRFFTTIEIKKKKEKKLEEKIEAVQEASGGIADPLQSSAGIRIMMWKACLKIIKEHPIFGIGPETLGYVFPKYRDLSYIRRFSEYSLTNRAHNEILDTAVNYGIIGLIIYIWLFFLVFSVGIKAISSSKDRLLLVGILCLQTAYLIQNEFSFGATTISGLSWVMIGVLAGITSQEKNIIVKSKAKRYLIGIPLILLSFIFIFSLIPYFIADIEFRKGRVYEESKLPDEAIKYYRRATSIYPFEQSYYHPLTQILLVRGKKEEIDEAIKLFKQALTYTPQSSSLWHSLGTAYYLRGGENAEDRAMACYSKVFEIDPYYAPSHHYIGVINKDKGRIDQARKSLEYAVNLRPDSPMSLKIQGY